MLLTSTHQNRPALPRKEFCVIFRTSSRAGKNPFIPIDSALTLKSLMQSFESDEIVCICDNVSDDQYQYFAAEFPCVYRTRRGNCGSFRLALRIAECHPACIYYFVEDDHLHLPNQKEWIREGLSHFDFVSLYDHPDKYMAPMYAELRRKVVLTPLGYFASSPSTVMTFACKAQTLKLCSSTMLRERFTGTSLAWPNDHDMFLELAERGHFLGTPIPGRSTHCEEGFLSPLIDWTAYVRSLRNC
ncbi:hypothetical protein [Synechococcus sp. BS55D]|uniref:hypothetical protein n=1 Tax=Synechococcus sp. BS55D TaxID=2055943 RepID=UPI00103E7C68|nr:hypothetical protein [Synechococcus sp. BS55D]